MDRVIVSAALFLPLLLGGPAAAKARDADSLAGMDAVVGQEWITAVTAFERALAASPEDPLRAARLSAARKQGGAFWAERARAFVEAGRWRDAALSAGLARHMIPGDGKVKGLVARIAKKETIPDDFTGLAPACPAYPGRSLEGRLGAMVALGPAHGEAADIIEGCLDYLVKVQEKDGSFSCKKYGGSSDTFDVGVSALALLALLGEGPSVLTGPRAPAVRKGIEYLLREQTADGCIGSKRNNHFLYCAAPAAEALAVYASIAREEERLGPALAKARDFLVSAQNPRAGWRYGIRPGDSDTSVTFWAVAALDAIRRAGLEVDEGAFTGAVAWVKRVTDREVKRVGYTAAGRGSARYKELIEKFPSNLSEALTAAGCLVRHYAGDESSRTRSRQVRLIRGVRPRGDIPDMYYWHLGARALVATTGTIPAKWFSALVEAAGQNRAADGSIRNAGPWGREGGTVMSTAFIALALMAPYAEPVTREALGATDFIEKGSAVVKVPADARLTPTGIYVDEGMVLRAKPSGLMRSYRRSKEVGPAGHKSVPKGRKRLSRVGPYGCLLGRVGADGKAFPIKREGNIKIKECGHLYFLTNDEDPSEATGELTVELELKKVRSPR